MLNVLKFSTFNLTYRYFFCGGEGSMNALLKFNTSDSHKTLDLKLCPLTLGEQYLW